MAGEVCVARDQVRLCNPGKSVGAGARRQSRDPVDDVEGNGLGRGGKRGQLVLAALGLEVARVVSGSIECSGSLSRLRILDQWFRFGGKSSGRRFQWEISFQQAMDARSRGQNELGRSNFGAEAALFRVVAIFLTSHAR